MADKTFNDVKINLTLKPQTSRANVSSSQEDLAVQMGKIQKWFADMDSHIPFNSHYGTCDTAAATVAKTVSCTGFTLTTGALIVVKFTVTNTGAVASLTLNVNNTGAKSIKYRGGNVSSPGYLAANRVYAFVYDGANWELIGDFANSNTYDRTYIQTRIYAGTKGVFPYSLCALDTAQRMQAFTTTGGTATTKVFNSSEKFAYPPVIMYHSQNATIANGSVITNGVLYEQFPNIDMRYNANVTTSVAYAQYKPLYVECTVDSDGYWSPTGITQTFTSGKYYILLGCMYSNSIYQLALFAQHPMYYYNGTKLIDAELHLQDGRYLPMAGGTMDNAAEITIPNGSNSSQYTGFGMYCYIGAGNGWARGINVHNATDGTRIGSLGMYGTADSTEPLYAYFGKTYNDAWYLLYKNIFRIQDAENSEFQFQYKPTSLSTGYSGSFLSLYSGNAYGYGIVIGLSHGGLTVVGSGESSKAFVDTAFDSTTSPYGSTVFQFDSEELVLSSDSAIWFLSGTNGLTTSAHTDWTNVKTALFDSSGNFRPSVDNNGSIGTSSFKWASIHGTTIYENGTSLASKYAAINHTHSTLNVGNVGNSNTPVYFSNGSPTAVTLPASGAWWSSEPHIDGSGVLEIGKYIDFHATAASTHNFDYRFEAVNTKEMMFSSADTDNVLTLNTAGYNQIRFKTTATNKSYTALGIVSYPLTTNGQTMLFQCGGNMVIGGGEFASNAYARKDSTGATQVGYDSIVTTEREILYLGADNEVQIIANAQNIGTYSNNDHVVWKFQTTGQLITPGAITDTLDLQHPMIQQSVRSASNCVTLAQWIVDGAASATYLPGISFHNMGGGSIDKGAIILRPYHHNADPWGKNVGLYIGKGVLKLDGTDVSLSTHTHNYAASATAGGTAKASESWKFTHGNELNVSKLSSSYHHCWLGYRFNTDGIEENGDDTYYIDAWYFGNGKGGKARVFPSAVQIEQITIQTGSSKAQKITLQTLMEWLITTRKYIHSNVNEHVVITTTFVYADNDILQFTVNGTNMELQLAGVFIEFIGKATTYNSGIFVLKITAAPTNSFTATSGYTKFWANHTAVYHCNGSGYSPAWSVDSSTVAFISSQSTSSTTKYYPVFTTGISGPRTLFANNGFYYNTKNGTTTADGLSELVIGNSTASGTAGNRQGNLAIYSLGAYYAQIRPTTLSANRTHTLPDETGEVMIRSTANSENQPILYASGVNYSTNPLDIEVTNIFTQWKVVYVVLERLIYGNASETAVSFQFLIPLQRVKALGTSPSSPYRIRVPYSNKNTLGEAYIDIKYVNNSKFTATYSLGQMAGGMGIWTVYGIY